MKELIEAIRQKHKKDGIDIYPPSTPVTIAAFEKNIGFPLPEEFKEFYFICNGFACTEDMFNMTPLQEIDHGTNWFHFAEYMIICDSWGLRITAVGQYEIFNASYPDIPMTSSLTEFLNRFLKGNVFDEGGLYDWMKELGIN